MLTRFKTLSVNQFTLITALFYVCIFNIPLFTFIHEGIEKQPEVDPLFIASMPLFFTFALGLVFSFFSVKYLLKPLFIVLTLMSSTVFFATMKYQVVFDYGMIE
ncbi:phosphoethanolamine transferase domain-containing protein, partial [Shewanella putrefaciens]